MFLLRLVGYLIVFAAGFSLCLFAANDPLYAAQLKDLSELLKENQTIYLASLFIGGVLGALLMQAGLSSGKSKSGGAA